MASPTPFETDLTSPLLPGEPVYQVDVYKNGQPVSTVQYVVPPTSRGKVACAWCGARGYLHGGWMRHHDQHVTCSCGKVVVKVGIKQHRGSMIRHGKPCP